MFQNIYEYFKNKIVRQELEGSFKSNSMGYTDIYLILLGVTNVILGIVSFWMFYNTEIVQIKYRSDVFESIYLKPGEYNIYIEVYGFYQNHLKYAKSINYDQLGGKTIDIDLKDCIPYAYKNGKPYYPAGMIANTFFQDVIEIENVKIHSDNISRTNEIKLIKMTNYNKSQIVRPQDWTASTNAGQKPLNTTEDSQIPILDERFVNWINISAFPWFKKLWGRMKITKGGKYKMKIESIFDYAKKGIYITQKNWLGIRNYFITFGLLLIGLSSIVLGFFIRFY